MAPNDRSDVILAGAGCAGLSMLWHLLSALGEQGNAGPWRILVVDATIAPADDRIWCFWGTAESPFADISCASWSQLRVAYPRSTLRWRTVQAGSRCEGLGDQAYYCVRGADYFHTIMSRARRYGGVEFLEGAIESIDVHDSGASVVVDGRRFQARWGFQSVRLSPQDQAAESRYALWQHFGGWEVELDDATWPEPDVATLMDFNVPQADGLGFMYVLPFDERHVLVESTVFGRRIWDAAEHDRLLQEYLSRHGVGSYRIVRRERGRVPMQDRRFSQRWGQHIFNVGTVGGMTKPTTGYTFQRIQAQARALATTLVVSGQPRPLQSCKPRYRLYDELLLEILSDEPSWGLPIFSLLFARQPIERILRFLDERSSIIDEARLFWSLPWSPFLVSLARRGGRWLDRFRERVRCSTSASSHPVLPQAQPSDLP